MTNTVLYHDIPVVFFSFWVVLVEVANIRAVVCLAVCVCSLEYAVTSSQCAGMTLPRHFYFFRSMGSKFIIAVLSHDL